MTKEAARRPTSRRASGPDDVDVIELHDCFTANELITYEALGLCAEEGEGHKLVDAEATTYGGKVGRQPVGRPDLEGPPARRHRPRAVHRAHLAAARPGRQAPGRGREGRPAAQPRPRRRVPSSPSKQAAVFSWDPFRGGPPRGVGGGGPVCFLPPVALLSPPLGGPQVCGARPPAAARPRPRRVGTAGGRGLVRDAVRKAARADARVHLDRARDLAARGPTGDLRGRALPPAAGGRHRPGQAAEELHPPTTLGHPDLPGGGGAEERGARRRDRATAGSRSSSPLTPRTSTARASRRGLPAMARAARSPTSRLRRRCR